MDRRTAIKWMCAAAAAVPLLERATFSAGELPVTRQGHGPDPDLLKEYKPGDLWPLTFTSAQRRTAIALCDVIIPADEISPKASDLGVHDFIDEWISSPYPAQKPDRKTILDGLTWIDEESRRRFQRDFADLGETQQIEICHDVARPAERPEYKSAAVFFKRYRDLTAGGFYTTPQGMKDIGYVGNVPLPSFEGPTLAALKHVGLA